MKKFSTAGLLFALACTTAYAAAPADAVPATASCQFLANAPDQHLVALRIAVSDLVMFEYLPYILHRDVALQHTPAGVSRVAKPHTLLRCRRANGTSDPSLASAL